MQRSSAPSRTCLNEINPESSEYPHPPTSEIPERIHLEIPPEELSASGGRAFSVVWGKYSTRKHKRWEGDAILIMEGRSAELKDVQGKNMGKGSGYPKGCSTIEQFRLKHLE